MLAGVLAPVQALPPPGGKLLKITPEIAAQNHPFKITMAANGTFTLPAPGSGPDINGAMLHIADLGPSSATGVFIDLPAPEWTRRQSNTSLKYIYNGLIGFHPCTGIVSGGSRWKLRCRGFTNFGAVTGVVATPFSGTARVQLAFTGSGITLCQEFGGIDKRNDATALIRKKAPPTTSCSPSGAFIDAELP